MADYSKGEISSHIILIISHFSSPLVVSVDELSMSDGSWLFRKVLARLNLEKKGANVLEKCLSDLHQYNDGIKKSYTQFPLNVFSQVKYLVGV